ncbi:MAG: DsbA family protein [Burkholderiaceae bacterium]
MKPIKPIKPVTARIEYFYSTHSAFAYLGSSLFQRIVSVSTDTVRYVPFDLRRALKASGHDTTGSLTEARRNYFFGREIERWSQYRRAPVMGARPTWHDHDLTLSSTLVIAAQQRHQDVGDLTHAMLTAHWKDDADLADPDALVQIAHSVGMNGHELLQEAAQAKILKIYRDNTDEAIERNIFGSPTYFVDGDMFYGQDRLELVERALQKAFD